MASEGRFQNPLVDVTPVVQLQLEKGAWDNAPDDEATSHGATPGSGLYVSGGKPVGTSAPAVSIAEPGT